MMLMVSTPKKPLKTTSRTTITLKGGLRARLDAEVRRTGEAFVDVVNDALSRGLDARQKQPKLPPFKVDLKHAPRGPRVPLDPASIKQILHNDEVERYLKLANRKPR